MAIFWRDLTAHRWHWFILIYFFGSSMRYVPKIWLPSVVSNIMVYGVIAVSNLNYLHLETGPDRGLTDKCFSWQTDRVLDSVGEYTGSELIVRLLIFLMWSIYPSVVIGCDMLSCCRRSQSVELAKKYWFVHCSPVVPFFVISIHCAEIIFARDIIIVLFASLENARRVLQINWNLFWFCQSRKGDLDSYFKTMNKWFLNSPSFPSKTVVN